MENKARNDSWKVDETPGKVKYVWMYPSPRPRLTPTPRSPLLALFMSIRMRNAARQKRKGQAQMVHVTLV